MVIAYLKGKVIGRSETMVTLAVGGVGYGIYLSEKDLLVSVVDDREVEYWIHTHFTQDSLKLYGFFTSFQRELFRYLTDLRAVGPRLALAILSHLTMQELLRVVSHQDISLLKSVPGIGQKKAQSLLLEFDSKKKSLLSIAEAARSSSAHGTVGGVRSSFITGNSHGLGNDGKAPDGVTSDPDPLTRQMQQTQKAEDDVRSALLNLGYARPEIEAAFQAASEAPEASSGWTFEGLFKRAMVSLRKPS